MPFVRLPKALKDNERLGSANLSALIWTTTPWTLPANKAIAVNESMEYTVIAIHQRSLPPADKEEDFLLVARERVDYLMSHLPKDTAYTTIVDSISGSQLADGQAACYNLFASSESPVLMADFVTASSGTGLVHSAPGHGMEDYQLCEQNNIGPAFAPVDDEGRYTTDAFTAGGHNALLTGLDVQTEGVEAVLAIMRESKRYMPSDLHVHSSTLVLATHKYIHKNPIDWRTKQPVIVRATAQWFADVSAIKDRALAALEDVDFIPDSGKTRLRSFVEGRSQWCISRQRAWGVPIPALYHKETGEACIRDESIEHVIETLKQKGTDAWFSDPPDDPSWIHPSLAENPWVRGKDTMDVWFDSGTTWTTLNPRDGMPISDVYLEGTDQHRGWFQSSLLTSIATQEAGASPKTPFAELVTHGFTLDAEGRKMSKSIGNVISPDQILDGSLLPPIKAKKQRGQKKISESKSQELKYDAMGPDVLRLWVASSDYTRDVSISVPVLQSVQLALQKLRVTFKFLLGVLEDYIPQASVPTDQMTFADRAVLHQLSKTSQEAWKAYTKYQFYKVTNVVNTFVNNDLSAFYFEIIKDTMYAGSKEVRRRTQTVLALILKELMHMLGPITPHLIEEVWEHAPSTLKDGMEHTLKSVWNGPYQTPEGKSDWNVLSHDLETFRHVSSHVKLAQEEARTAGKLGSGLACKVEIQLPDTAAPSMLSFHEQWTVTDKRGELADLLVVSQAHIVFKDSEGKHDIPKADWSFEQSFEAQTQDVKGKVVVMPPEKEKCVRCWKYTAEEKDVPCQRCQTVLQEMGWSGG